MLISISCDKLIEPTLNFHNGLNSIVGANDGHNSIGKSSTLMLIDFAFGGDDFPQKCIDTIKHVGEIEIKFEFSFDINYRFSRNTSNPNELFFENTQELISLDEYRLFLQEKYNLQKYDLSFRNCIGAFFRIYQRHNYNEEKPLHNSPNETWASIRKRILSLFQKYSLIKNLELEIKEKSNANKAIIGSYDSGAINKINKTTFKHNSNKIQSLQKDLELLKDTLENNFINIQEVINDKNLELFEINQSLQKRKGEISTLLARSRQNLSYLPSKSQKDIKALIELFPNINTDRLLEIDSFHNGINKIMKDRIKEEQSLLNIELNSISENIEKIELKINFLKENNQANIILNDYAEKRKLLETLSQENSFFENHQKIKDEIKSLKAKLNSTINGSLRNIETTINTTLKNLISKIYTDNSIFPTIEFTDKNYIFHAGDDTGTGKKFANMIALDLALLQETPLPCIIHDSLLLKNIGTRAVENIIALYSKSSKQIFISIDEISKYNLSTRVAIEKSKFLELNEKRFAFKKSWKTKK